MERRNGVGRGRHFTSNQWGGGKGRPPTTQRIEREDRCIRFRPRRDLKVPNSDEICGIKGRKIVLETNYFGFKIRDVQKLKCFLYEVVIEQPDTAKYPNKFKKLYGRIMDTFRQEHYNDHYPAFDGMKNLYVSKLLKSEYCGEVFLNLSNSHPLKFKVALKYAKQVDLSPLYRYNNCSNLKNLQEVYQFISIVLRASPLLTCISVGRNFYRPPIEGSINLSSGIEMYYGFHQSLMLSQRGPMVNVDVVHKAFISPKNVLELI